MCEFLVKGKKCTRDGRHEYKGKTYCLRHYRMLSNKTETVKPTVKKAPPAVKKPPMKLKKQPEPESEPESEEEDQDEQPDYEVADYDEEEEKEVAKQNAIRKSVQAPPPQNRKQLITEDKAKKVILKYLAKKETKKKQKKYEKKALKKGVNVVEQVKPAQTLSPKGQAEKGNPPSMAQPATQQDPTDTDHTINEGSQLYSNLMNRIRNTEFGPPTPSQPQQNSWSIW